MNDDKTYRSSLLFYTFTFPRLISHLLPLYIQVLLLFVRPYSHTSQVYTKVYIQQCCTLFGSQNSYSSVDTLHNLFSLRFPSRFMFHFDSCFSFSFHLPFPSPCSSCQDSPHFLDYQLIYLRTCIIYSHKFIYIHLSGFPLFVFCLSRYTLSCIPTR